ncbi:MAG: adenylyl-sulfate kinase [Gammaproteobacteria bacterium]|nr:adenylyl-sulfate kinase [Gammaproteobacteria bacterium]
MRAELNTVEQDWLRIVTCGSVDDGKSTLLGRLIAASQSLSDDQWHVLERDSARHGKAGVGKIDYALLVDGLEDEVAQGITIDVAYRYFASAKRKFVVADSPGHVQYTRNMVTAASNADVGLLLVDAQQGISEQTRRHLFILDMMGITEVVIAINKMDLVAFSEARFCELVGQLETLSASMSLRIHAQPVAARDGDGIAEDGFANMPWFAGVSLLAHLEQLSPKAAAVEDASLWVQGVIRPDHRYRGYTGQLDGGSLAVGDQIEVLPSRKSAVIESISVGGASKTEAFAGHSVAFELDRELDISRGDLVVKSGYEVQVGQRLRAQLVWMDEQPLRVGRRYRLRLGTRWVDATITRTERVLDVEKLQFEPASEVGLNDIVWVEIDTETPVAFSPYAERHKLGAFVLVDKVSLATVGAGMLSAALARDSRIPFRDLAENRPSETAKLLWITGLPKSGKSSLANALADALKSHGHNPYVLDFSNIRLGLNRDLGFSDADRVEHRRRVAEVAKLMLDAGVTVIAAFVSPFAHERRAARDTVGESRFCEIYLDTPVEICKQRDTEGQFARARQGKLAWVPGVNSDYDVPTRADIHLDGQQSIESLVKQVLAEL